MKPHIIIDIRDRSIFSLLIDRKGNIWPCTHNVSENSLRYFFGEVLIDLEQYEEWENKKNPDLLDDVEDREYDIIRVGKKMGWMRPYEANESLIALKHPLKVLSSILNLENMNIMKDITATCCTLMEFLLEPIFHYIGNTNFQFNDLKAVIILPDYFNRHAQLVLHKILRKKKFCNSLMITREMATMMSFLENIPMESAAILDMEEEDTNLYQVRISKSQNIVWLECATSSTLAKFGWHSLLNRFIYLLNKDKMTAGTSANGRLYFDNALLGLIFGIQPSRFHLPSSLHITHALFDKLFSGKVKGVSTKKYFSKFCNWIDGNISAEEFIIPLGLPPMIGNFENLLFSALGDRQRAPLLQYRSLERPAYGVAVGINWLSHGGDRVIKMVKKAGFKVATRVGESILLAPHTSLPVNPGEQRVLRRVLDFCLEETVSEDILTFQLLWGVNPNPQYNVNVCLVTLNVTQDDIRNKRKVWVTLDLKRNNTGNYLKGTVTVQLGGQRKKANFRVVHGCWELHSQDIEGNHILRSSPKKRK